VASSQNIVGSITAIVVHRDFVHLGFNMCFAFLTLATYFLSSTFSGNKNHWSMTAVILLSAILANFVYVLSFPFPVSGSSGLVYAFMGGTSTSAFVSAWSERDRFLKGAQFVIGLFLLAIFITLNILASSDTNLFVHVISFFLSTVFILFAHFWNRKVRVALWV
jgi:membrane associated rhomboid family serine protease